MELCNLDSFRNLSTESFTFDNRRSNTNLTMSKSYCFYIFDEFDKKEGHLDLNTLLKIIFYHSLVVFQICQNYYISPPNPFFDLSILTNLNCKCCLIQVWKDLWSTQGRFKLMDQITLNLVEVQNSNTKVTKTKSKKRRDQF